MKKAVSLILIILLFATTAFAVVACSSEQKETKNYFTVVSYNTRSWDLKDWDGVTHDERIASIKAQIASVNPDIVGLQEIDKNSGRSKNLDYAKVFSPANYYDYFAQALRVGDYSIYGIATLTKEEAVSVQQYNLPNPVKEELIANASIVDKIALSVSVENRVVQRTVINFKGTQIAFYNTHTSFESAEMRVAQINFIYSLMEEDEIPYRICVGDFNTGDGVDELQVFFEKYNLCISDNFTVTFPPNSTIDNIIYSRNLSANNFQVYKTPHSDHYMLSCDFKIIG